MEIVSTLTEYYIIQISNIFLEIPLFFLYPPPPSFNTTLIQIKALLVFVSHTYIIVIFGQSFKTKFYILIPERLYLI